MDKIYFYFNKHLKLLKSELTFKSFEKEFHSLGPLTEKDVLKYKVLAKGTYKRCYSDERVSRSSISRSCVKL